MLGAALEGRRGATEIETAAEGRWDSSIDVEPLSDAAGKVLGGLCVWRDVTARRRLAEEFERRGA